MDQSIVLYDSRRGFRQQSPVTRKDIKMALSNEDRKEVSEAAAKAAGEAAAGAVKEFMKESPCHFSEEERRTFHELSRNLNDSTLNRLNQIMQSDAVSEANLPMFLSALRIASAVFNNAVRWIAVAILAAVIAAIMIGLNLVTGGKVF